MSKLLAITFRQDGMDYVQVQRKGNVAIYKKTKGPMVAYEVIVINDERYPTDMSWGTYGWTYKDLADAKEKAKTESYLIDTE